MSRDKAGPAYWERNWRDAPVARAVDPRTPGVRNRFRRVFHERFVETFRTLAPRGRRLLEIGCARSTWLPYFAKEFGFAVTGLDYSPVGCEQSEQLLRDEGVEATIVCADLFSPPTSLLATFDVVVSFGVVEHFRDTADCMTAFARFLRPGGLVFTMIPNLAGLIGTLQKLLDRSIYDIHVPLDREALATAHARAGLDVVDCDYFMFTSFGMINLAGSERRFPSWHVRRKLLDTLSRLSTAVWFVEEQVGALPANRLTAPYINCLARKPETRSRD